MDDKGISDLTISVGDQVKIISGYLKGKTGILEELDLKEEIVVIDGEEIKAHDGTALVAIQEKNNSTGKDVTYRYKLPPSALCKNLDAR